MPKTQAEKHRQLMDDMENMERDIKNLKRVAKNPFMIHVLDKNLDHWDIEDTSPPSENVKVGKVYTDKVQITKSAGDAEVKILANEYFIAPANRKAVPKPKPAPKKRLEKFLDPVLDNEPYSENFLMEKPAYMNYVRRGRTIVAEGRKSTR